MPELKNWYMERRYSLDGKDKFVICGNVYHSPKFEDGRFITSSQIKHTVNYKNEERLEVHTKNSVYECYWVDCDFEEGDTQEYLMDYAHYKDEYLMKDIHMEENSILLLLDERKSCFLKQGLYKRNGEVKTLNIWPPKRSIRIGLSYKILQSEESGTENIDIRVSETQYSNALEVVYTDVPNDMKVFVKNVGRADISLFINQTEMHISEQEQMQLELTGYINYRKLIKICNRNKEWLPRRQEPFQKEAVYRQIEEDAVNHIEKEYLLFIEYESENKEGMPSISIHAGIGKGLETAIMLEEYDLAKRLVQQGVSIELERTMMWSTFNEQGNGIDLELTFMELLCEDGIIPDDLYTLIWQRLKVQEAIPLKQALCLQIKFDIEKSRKVAIKSVKRLQEQWEEAADELLLAWIKYYLNEFFSTETEVWEELLAAFPDKKKLVFEEIVKQHFRIYDERSSFIYPREQRTVAIPSYWQMCKKDMDDRTRKELIVSTIHKLLTKKRDVLGMVTYSNKMVIIENKLDSDWLIYELLYQEKDFGDLQMELRDNCIRKLFDYEGIEPELWQTLLKSTFLPMEFLDIYIDELLKREVKWGYILPLFISTKMKKMVDKEEHVSHEYSL